MAIQVTINGSQYTLNQQGDPAPWGNDQQELIQALIAVASASTSAGDILPSTFTLANNVTSPTPISSLVFDQSVVRSAIIQFSVDRSTATQELTEAGYLYITYNSTTNSWSHSQDSVGNSQLLFDVTAGQVTYTCSNLTGGSYAGKLGFSARAFAQ